MWDKLKEQFNLLKLEKKKLCLVTNSDRFVSKDEFLDAVASALQGGVDMVLLSENNIPDGVIVDIGRKLRILCDEYGATFIVNNRADIALIVEADGVHLEQNGIRIADAREVLPENAIVGKSVSTPDEIKNAVKFGADYLILRPIIEKNNCVFDYGIITGVKENVKIPVFLSGDITLANIQEYLSYGIEKFAIGEAVMYAKIPELTAREFVKVIDR